MTTPALDLCGERQKLLQTNGHLVVRGGAGSGKTTISLVKARVELEGEKLGGFGKVLFLSFARATVARVIEQALATIREHRARIEINTYHGFAWWILKSHAYLVGGRRGVSLLLPAMARTRLVGLTGEERKVRQRELFMREGLVAFDLFATLATEILRGCPILAKAYAGAYPLIIVDEFQDTNADEWSMIRCLGRHSRIIALGDPKQRIYDFKGADPKRFDEFIAAFSPTEFDFKGENRRSAGTAIAAFADDVMTGEFSASSYEGVAVEVYTGQTGLRHLKLVVFGAAKRLNKNGAEWSLAILVPSNALAGAVYDYMLAAEQGLPRAPFAVDIAVSSEGPTLAAQLIALLLEPWSEEGVLVCALLEGLAAFHLGRSENPTATAKKQADTYTSLKDKVRKKGLVALDRKGVARDVAVLLKQAIALKFSGAPMTDWVAARRVFDENPRDQIKFVGKESRYMRLLRRGAQIEARLGDAWRAHGCYRQARELLDAALVEDQFAAATRPHYGVTIMTIHKSKGKEFDEVMVFEGTHRRFHWGQTAEAIRSARYNLHVAVTRARRAVTIFTPKSDPSPLLK